MPVDGNRGVHRQGRLAELLVGLVDDLDEPQDELLQALRLEVGGGLGHGDQVDVLPVVLDGADAVHGAREVHQRLLLLVAQPCAEGDAPVAGVLTGEPLLHGDLADDGGGVAHCNHFFLEGGVES